MNQLMRLLIFIGKQLISPASAGFLLIIPNKNNSSSSQTVLYKNSLVNNFFLNILFFNYKAKLSN